MIFRTPVSKAKISSTKVETTAFDPKAVGMTLVALKVAFQVPPVRQVVSLVVLLPSEALVADTVP